MKVLDPHLVRVDAAGWEMVGQRCAHCGKLAFPRKRVCPECFGTDLPDFTLSRSGTLHTFTCTHLGPPALPSPYLLALVDLQEGIKLMGLIEMNERWKDTLEVGMPIEIVLAPMRRDADGEEIWCYMFKPLAIGSLQCN